METLSLEQCRQYLKNLQEVSICQVCHEPLRSPDIVVCHNGHAVCASCKQQLPSCAVCRTFFCNGKPTTLCKMVAELPRFCSNNYGCNHMLMDKDDHEKWCHFRLLQCTHCDAHVEVRTLLKHLSEAHNCQPHDVDEIDFKKIDTGLQINGEALKLYDGHMFTIQYIFSPTEKALMVYMTFYPLKKVEDNILTLKLELFCNETNLCSTTYQDVNVVFDVKSLVFNIPDWALRDFSGENVSFKTSIVSVIEIED